MSYPKLDLPAPPPLAPAGLRVTPLGGLGEIGRNMTVFEYAGRLLIVDCGVLFPEEHHPGVDLILPDFSAIRDRLDAVEALVLTHGHEDHIGAAPYLLRERGDIPLVGSELTLALLGSKLREHRLKETVHHVVREGDRITLGPFDLEFVAVNHSIPDALAVAIRTGAGLVLHTGDFKMDQLPLDGRVTDLRAFSRLGEEGVDLFLTDSTNAEVPGFTTHEKDISPVLDRVFHTSQQRIIVACFASHVHRVQQVLDVAAKHGRKVGYVGRSMVRNMAIAQDLGYLHVPPGVMVDAKELADLAPERQVLVSTGSQGEPLSALSRIAQRNHNFVHIEEGDTVILASSLIPGNENAVYRVINGLSRWGATVVHKGNALVHVSGHASAGELLYCYNVVKPRNVLPVHGEIRHLRANGDLAKATGVPAERIILGEDGVVVDLVDGVARIAGKVDCGYVFVDGTSVGEITEESLQDRRVLGEEGFVSVIVVLDVTRGAITAGPTLTARGFAEDDSTFDAIKPGVVAAVNGLLYEGVTDAHQIQQAIRRVIGRWVNNTYRRRPMILPVVLHTDDQAAAQPLTLPDPPTL
ncbi:MAG: ribonuclease J [Nocardioides sp.]